MANYWLFTVMFDHYPELWREFVQNGIAAQHYPPGWTLEEPNVKRLASMKRGDKIIAAFQKHRFAGYGELKSDFYRGGPALQIEQGPGKYLEFMERFDCDWTVIPIDRTPPFVKCRDLKASGSPIDLERGRAVRQIDKNTYRELTARLDVAGARKRPSIWIVKAREVLKSGEDGWHWREYFDGPDRSYDDWGGTNWVGSRYSMKLLKTKVRKGDLVVA